MYFWTPFLWVVTLLVAIVLGYWVSNADPSRKDLRDPQEHGEKTIGDTPMKPPVRVLSKELLVSPLPYPTLMYFGSSRHQIKNYLPLCVSHSESQSRPRRTSQAFLLLISVQARLIPALKPMCGRSSPTSISYFTQSLVTMP